MVMRWLEHPLTRGLPLDSPETTRLRRTIVETKPFLRKVYEEWYSEIAQRLPHGSGGVLELGSGAGFLQERVPEVIRSEVFPCPDLAVILDARQLPFVPGSLKAIVMTDVLHHIPDVRRFLIEASGAVRAGGVVIMIEPWVTTWSRFVYTNFHHEPFRPDAEDWTFAESGPLSSANGALPWIVFERDRRRFSAEFHEWRIESIRLGMPVRYLLSGGVSLRSLMPGWTFPGWRGVERVLQPWMDRLAMFATIVLRRTDAAAKRQQGQAGTLGVPSMPMA
jgi:SAM-dependent methyltransferase